MLNDEELAARRAEVASAPELAALLARLRESAARVIATPPSIPGHKALLSRDGGFCPHDGSALRFDPWSAGRHQCPQCQAWFEGGRHDRAWARFEHLWIGERIAHLATLATVGDDADAGDAAARLIEAYGARYLDFPNADNVLGPARLFFSTYLESIWITNVMAGALLLRDAGLLSEDTGHAVEVIANEAAGLIGEFNEGMSNRQVWHNAALASLALWFEDEELLQSAVRGPNGLFEQLLGGFGPDGMWFEGENYHLFALRGMLIGLSFARAAGLDAWQSPELARRLLAALRAPIATALPDHTFPARKDSRFGVSLAQPMYLELWEAGLAADPTASDLAAWLRELYDAPAPAAREFDSWLHEAGLETPAMRGRADLSWWTLLFALPALPDGQPSPRERATFLESQGLAVLRSDARYVSLECGSIGGGHGHPDRLALTLHQDGIHWLADPGAGSYVSRDLFWYRSTLAHNAPRLDCASQGDGDTACEFMGTSGDWAAVRGRWGDVRRTVVSGPGGVLDVLEFNSHEPHQLELPWHPDGEWDVISPGHWEAAPYEGEFLTQPERWTPGGSGPLVMRAQMDGRTLTLTMTGAQEWWRIEGPGRPGMPRATFLLARANGVIARFVTVITSDQVPGLEVRGDAIDVTIAGSPVRHRADETGWIVEAGGTSTVLRGARITRVAVPAPATHSAAHAAAVVLGGGLSARDLPGLVEPLELDREDQYRRSEEPWDEGALAARAWAGWSDAGLDLLVEVTKAGLLFRPADAPPLLLDNERDDINSDGIEVFLRLGAEAAMVGYLVVPEVGGTLRVSSVGTSSASDVQGDWEETDEGYRVALRVMPPGWDLVHRGDSLGFDLIINEMRPGRERRAGQLVWSGDGGWVWLRGDRHEASSLGELELT